VCPLLKLNVVVTSWLLVVASDLVPTAVAAKVVYSMVGASMLNFVVSAGFCLCGYGTSYC